MGVEAHVEVAEGDREGEADSIVGEEVGDAGLVQGEVSVEVEAVLEAEVVLGEAEVAIDTEAAIFFGFNIVYVSMFYGRGVPVDSKNQDLQLLTVLSFSCK